MIASRVWRCLEAIFFRNVSTTWLLHDSLDHLASFSTLLYRVIWKALLGCFCLSRHPQLGRDAISVVSLSSYLQYFENHSWSVFKCMHACMHVYACVPECMDACMHACIDMYGPSKGILGRCFLPMFDLSLWFVLQPLISRLSPKSLNASQSSPTP